MSTFWWTIGGALVGAVVALVWRQTRKPAVERMLRMYRSVMGSEVEYRDAGPDDHDLMVGVDFATPAELERQLVRLPDLVMMVGGNRYGIVRPFLDDTGTAVVYVVYASFEETAVASIAIESHTEDEEYVSTRGGRESIAFPPFAHYQYLPATISIADLLTKHRSFVGGTTCIKFVTKDDVARELQRKHAALAAWRNAQPADELLEQDVQKLLGAKYKRHGKEWIGRLGVKIPKAHVRRQS